MLSLKKRKPPAQAATALSPLQNWVIWAENRIASVITHEGLFVQMVSVVRGPMTITFTVRLLHPTPTALRKLLGLGPTLAQALSVEGVRVADSAKGISIETPSPEPMTPTVAFLIEHTAGVNVCVGMGETRQPITVNLSDYPALMFVGPTRKGKTAGMKAALAALLLRNQDLGAIIIGRRQNWQDFTRLPGVLDIIGEHAVAQAAAEWLGAELNRRNNASTQTAPALVLIVDDLPFVLQNAPAIANPLGNLAGAGGAVGLYLMVATQFAGSKAGSGGAALEANILTKIMYKSATKAQAALSAGRGGSGSNELSGAKGDAVLIMDGGERRVATAWIPDNFWRTLPTGQGGAAAHVPPWRQNGHGTGQNGPERPKTGQNGAERAGDPPPTHATVQPFAGGEEVPRSERSARSEPPNADETIRLRIESLRRRIATAQPSGPLFSTKAPPSPAEAHAVRVLFDLVGSREKLYPLVTGPKNGERQRWLAAALGGEA